MYNLPVRYTTSDLFNNYNIRSLESLYVVKANEFIHQVLNQERQSQIEFLMRHEVHQYQTRQSENISLPHVRSRQGMNSLLYKGAAEDNKLPSNIKELNTKKFKPLMKKNVPLYL